MFKHHFAIKVTGLPTNAVVATINALLALADHYLGAPEGRWSIVADADYIVVMTKRAKDGRRLERVVLAAAA